MQRTLVAGALAVLLSACATQATQPRNPPPATPGVAEGATLVQEAWISADVVGEELDSLATWSAEDGRTWLLATGKSGHRLTLFDGDSGAVSRTVGARGEGHGSFNRPNGITVFGDLVFVVERDNRRVQVLSLPGFEPLGAFGQAELRSPYGIWLNEVAPGELDAYVTDSFMYGARFDVLPADQELDQRVRRYRLEPRDDGMAARYLGAFGATSGAGKLHMVESIAGDPAHDRLLIAEEDRNRPSNLREYDLAGRFAGRSLPEGTFDGEAEGVVLWSCGVDSGYWIAVDQQAPLTRFHVFARADLAPVGSFHGARVARTDGIALHAAATTRFPAGAFYAVHNDLAVAAFDLRDLVQALRLDPACLH
ncbi:phytase [Luteimonas sp. MC1825]|uniref:phytase n=1 Tax=Luteimonas sp. MC1825 TaxID=2761107 RepID=UPI00160CFA45|nr:phytase [Luteimonas sp. MC1825]MBB6598527.1 phytase [Luteimonas sp. MC1825]QOC88712.1 phytase [Luteimonas sp. MC1825]